MILDTFESISFVIELWKSMSRAMNDTEDLRQWDQEIEYLREEEKEHSFCEVTENTHHGKGHTRKVAKCVSNKNFWGELVMFEQTQGHKDKRNDDCHREDMMRHYFSRCSKINLL